MQWVLFSVLIKRIKAIKFFLRDPKVPIRKKLIIFFGILYLLNPIDLIPLPVLGFGIIDDLTIWGFIIYYLKDELDKYWIGEKETPPDFKGKKIIDDVNFETKDGEKDD